jgi:hypothetical protein
MLSVPSTLALIWIGFLSGYNYTVTKLKRAKTILNLRGGGEERERVGKREKGREKTNKQFWQWLGCGSRSGTGVNVQDRIFAPDTGPEPDRMRNSLPVWVRV